MVFVLIVKSAVEGISERMDGIAMNE